MDRETFREQMLSVMERKNHWAWPFFTSGRVPKDRLHFHFEQEYETYVRDFPIMVGRAYVRCPIAAIRRSLAENLYEEETGGLVAGKSPPAFIFRISARPRHGSESIRACATSPGGEVLS